MANDHPGYEDYAGPMIKRNGVCNCTTGAHDGPHATWCMIHQHAPTSGGCEQTDTHEKCCGHGKLKLGICNCDRMEPYNVKTGYHSPKCSIWNTGEQYGRSPAIDALHATGPWEKGRFKKESAERKAAPLWSGVMVYFPDALLAVARLSKKANDKHNPGEPLHWSKKKSNDHGDCLTRHQLEPEKLDLEVGEIHAVHVAWRALAQLQTIIERQRGK